VNNMQALLQLASVSFDSKIWMPEVRFLTEIWLGGTDTRFEVTDGTGGWHRLVWHQADPMLREAAWRVLVTNSDD